MSTAWNKLTGCTGSITWDLRLTVGSVVMVVVAVLTAFMTMVLICGEGGGGSLFRTGCVLLPLTRSSILSSSSVNGKYFQFEFRIDYLNTSDLLKSKVVWLCTFMNNLLRAGRNFSQTCKLVEIVHKRAQPQSYVHTFVHVHFMINILVHWYQSQPCVHLKIPCQI